jgi:hypothetical protein
MEGLVSSVGAIVAGLCAVLLLRAYLKVRKRLLLWSGVCFAGLAGSNALAFVDLQIYPVEVDLYPWRLTVAAVAMLVLVVGLVLDHE